MAIGQTALTSKSFSSGWHLTRQLSFYLVRVSTPNYISFQDTKVTRASMAYTLQTLLLHLIKDRWPSPPELDSLLDTGLYGQRASKNPAESATSLLTTLWGLPCRRNSGRRSWKKGSLEEKRNMSSWKRWQPKLVSVLHLFTCLNNIILTSCSRGSSWVALSASEHTPRRQRHHGIALGLVIPLPIQGFKTISKATRYHHRTVWNIRSSHKYHFREDQKLSILTTLQQRSVAIISGCPTQWPIC